MNLKEIAHRIASKIYPSDPRTGSDEPYRLQRVKYVSDLIESELKLLDLCDVSNLIFTGIGYCGMSKDIEVRGRLTEVRKEHSHATITDEKGQPHAVNLRTVKICC